MSMAKPLKSLSTWFEAWCLEVSHQNVIIVSSVDHEFKHHAIQYIKVIQIQYQKLPDLELNNGVGHRKAQSSKNRTLK